jgi:hypothetical protein
MSSSASVLVWRSKERDSKPLVYGAVLAPRKSNAMTSMVKETTCENVLLYVHSMVEKCEKSEMSVFGSFASFDTCPF